MHFIIIMHFKAIIASTLNLNIYNNGAPRKRTYLECQPSQSGSLVVFFLEIVF